MFYRLSDLVNCFERFICAMDTVCHRFMPTRVYLNEAYCYRLCLLWKHWVSQVFALMCLERLCCLRGGDSVRAVLCSIMSDDTSDGACVPVATTAHPQPGGSRCFHWLCFVRQGAGPVAPPINGRERTVLLNQRGVVVYVRIVYTQHRSVPFLQVTGSLLLVILVCCCIVLSSCTFLHVTELFSGTLIQFVCLTCDFQSMMTVYHISDAMASGDSRPEVNQSRVSFEIS